jgi:hypothetical protein
VNAVELGIRAVNSMTNCKYSSEYENECPSITDFCILVHSLVQNINSLEEEVVRWRHALLKYLPINEAEELRCDIFSNLTGSIDFNEAYQLYVEKMCLGRDPMDDDEHINRMFRLRDGKDDTTITL